MKIIKIILITFAIAFAVSGLLVFDFFSKEPLRYWLVVILATVVLVFGFFEVKSIGKSGNKNEAEID